MDIIRNSKNIEEHKDLVWAWIYRLLMLPFAITGLGFFVLFAGVIFSDTYFGNILYKISNFMLWGAIKLVPMNESGAGDAMAFYMFIFAPIIAVSTVVAYFAFKIVLKYLFAIGQIVTGNTIYAVFYYPFVMVGFLYLIGPLLNILK